MQEKHRNRSKYVWMAFVCLVAVMACNLPLLANNSSSGQLAPGPTVAFQEPAPGKAVALGEAFPVFVTATDPLGVSRIELWVGDALVLSQTAPEEQTAGVTPLVLSYSLVGTQPGTHAMVARAYNSVGVLGESLAVHITVSQGQASASESVAVQYIVQQGDTLESIAEATKHSEGAIQRANPGMGKQLNPGQPVVIPNVPGGQPPQQPPAQPPGAQIMPGLLPNQQGGLVEIAPGQMPQLAPSLFPDFQPPQNALNPSLSAPTSLTATASDCSVSLQWQDTTSGKAGFTIYRRRVPDQAAPQIVANVTTKTTSYVDKVPGPGKYEYAVEVSGALQFMPSDQNFIQQNMLAASRSAPVSVQVDPGAACITDPGSMKYVHIQIQDVILKHAGGKGVTGAALWYSVNDSPGRRVPANQGQYNPSGSWSFGDEVVPVSNSLLLNSGQNVIVKFWVSGLALSDNYPPMELGEAFNAHNPVDIDTKADNYYVADSKNFKVEYKIWIEDVQWTGNGTTRTIPAPENLRILRTTATSRVVTWDWNGDATSVDGYIFYKAYSCPGMDTQTYAPQMIAAPAKQTEIAFKSEPMGCVYRYQVSAFGRKGESAPSKPLDGDTEAAYGIAGVTLSEMKFNSLPDGKGGVKINFYVNQHQRETGAYWVQPGGYNLANWMMDGRRPHNAFGLPLGEKEFLTIGFAVSGVDNKGYIAQNSVCTGASILPPLSAWAQENWSTTIRSTDGACELTVNLTSQPPQATSSGGTVMPQADISIENLALIGSRVFAYIENNGPDDLPNNSLVLIGELGYRCQDKDEKMWCLGFYHPIRVQSNLPQWVHIDPRIDEIFRSMRLDDQGSWFYSPPKEGCDFGFFISYRHAGTYQSGDKPNFSDPDPGNDVLFMPAGRILPMK
ncbi:MAG: LysM peptidoglycan-binding domain-containing protein [Anaerolineaceae bacterium]|nr:LysM peptidoglycan-binding domain-containing protein [Anaerolineaceae bacterium]